jgi:opacity protein-like surface antigen
MKKSFLSICLSLAFGTLCLAQDGQNAAEKPAFEMNKHYISAGIGAGNFYQTFFRLILNSNEENSASFSSVGPLFFKYEYALTDKFGLGVHVASITNKANYTYDNNNQTFNAELTCNAYSILARANYHFVNRKVIDPYVGLGLGYKGYKLSFTDNNQDRSKGLNTIEKGLNQLPNFPLGVELTFGFRVMPTNFIGFYMETGLAKGVIQGGLVAKF